MTELLTELAPSLQKMVDARLDNIDRALLSTDITRYERRQIVSAVEDQIQELVARINRQEPSREDIIRILASLDPPEVYGSGSMQPSVEHESQREFNRLARSQSAPSIEPRGNILAIVSVTLAAASLMAIPSVFVISIFAFIISAILSMAALICGIVALCQLVSTKGKVFAKGMSILGIVSFPVGLLMIFMLFFVLTGL